MTIYNHNQWQQDRTFSAHPGQEITPEIYEDMFNCLPPLRLPCLPQTEGFIAGFLSSEPHAYVNGKAVYAAFGRRNDRYFFLGYLPRG